MGLGRTDSIPNGAGLAMTIILEDGTALALCDSLRVPSLTSSPGGEDDVFVCRHSSVVTLSEIPHCLHGSDV